MENKKGLLIGLAAAGFMTISIGAQVLTTHQEIVTMNNLKHEVRNVQMAIKQQTIIQKQTQQAALKQQISALEAATFEDDSVTEEFKITLIDDAGYVHGELTTGTGEGIYYPIDTMKAHGAGDLHVDDIVQVTWSLYAYDNENWDDIEKIEKIVE